MTDDPADRLSSYPYVIVRFACDTCKRRDAYRLARLAAKFGAEAGMTHVLLRWSWDCPWRQDARSGSDSCGAYYPDLGEAHPPPDLPPGLAPLRVIDGGKKVPAAPAPQLRRQATK